MQKLLSTPLIEITHHPLHKILKLCQSTNELHVISSCCGFCVQVRRNVTDVAYHIAQYTNIISELRDEILKLRSRLQDQGTGSRTHANIQAVQCEYSAPSLLRSSI